mgnify:FL=1
MTIEAFTLRTSSNEPVPGGGSISALAGALAAALSEMVAGLTIGKKKYAEVEEEMKAQIPVLCAAKEKLLEDIRRDSESFDLFMQALTLPKDTEEEKAVRKAAMQEGLKAAVMVPLSVAEASVDILPSARLMVEKGNQTAVTDALVSAMMARTAVLGACFNVRINLASIEDEAFTAEIGAKTDALEAKAVALEKEILGLSAIGKGALGGIGL